MRLHFQEFGSAISRTTVRRWWAATDGTVLQRGGSVTKHSAAAARYLCRLVEGGPALGADGLRVDRHSIRRAIPIFNHRYPTAVLSLATAHRILRAAGLVAVVQRDGPGITLLNVGQRRAFHRLHGRHAPRWWLRVVFSDSTMVHYEHRPNSHNDKVWIRRGDRVPTFPRRRRPKKTLHVYGALTRHGMVGPIFVEGRVTGEIYRAGVLPKLILGVQALFRKNGDLDPWVWMQDGAGPHVADATQLDLAEFKARGVCDFWGREYWPGNSPDLNPIEGFWSVLQAAVSPRGVQPRPTATLKRNVKAWFRVRHKESCVKALVGMRARMDELVVRDFGTTSH